MRIDTISALMDRLVELYGDVSFPTDLKRNQWEPQYRASLGSLTPDELNAAFHGCMDAWRKHSSPMPADFLAAHKVLAPSPAGKQSAHGDSLFACLKRRDDALRNAKHDLAEKYEALHADGYTRARQEGWVGLLATQVAKSANIIAQRDLLRGEGKTVPALSEGEKLDYGISVVGGFEDIEITQANIAIWRDWLSTPAKRISNNIPKMNFAGEAA